MGRDKEQWVPQENPAVPKESWKPGSAPMTRSSAKKTTYMPKCRLVKGQGCRRPRPEIARLHLSFWKSLGPLSTSNGTATDFRWTSAQVSAHLLAIGSNADAA